MRRHLSWLVLPLCVASLLAPSATAGRAGQSIDVYRPGFMGEDSLLPGDLDARAGSLLPTRAQRAEARALGARVSWNQFGTPRSVFNVTGYLSAPAKGDPAEIARGWVRRHAGLFRLDAAATAADRLEMTSNIPLYESPDNRRIMHGLKPLAKDDTLPHVVMFQQVFDGVPTSQEGLLTVALDRQNRVTHASSSVSGDPRVTNTAIISPLTAWVKAAADVGWHVKPADVTLAGKVIARTFTGIKVAGQPEVQMARLRALPTPRDGVRLVFETNVMDNTRVGKDEPLGYTSFVDAETGRILLRMNAIDYFDPSMAASIRTQAPLPEPRWKIFPNIPPLPQPGVQTPDTRKVWCWSPGAGCDMVIGGTTGPRVLPQLRYPYDEVPNDTTSVPSGTSLGNNADTTSSYLNHVAGDVPQHAAGTTTPRDYTFAFTDQWHTSNCAFAKNKGTAAQNDVNAAIINLFVNYGRMHDWSYYLGFTESTWNMQAHNFGEDSGDGGLGGDPEVGQAQAGGLAGSVLYTGRDNANQRTMQDGVAPITNQYLWHPLQAGFYSPCVDGAYDMGIVAHEYTHAISNRMIGGPEASIGGSEGPKMGESWSDLAAMEYINGYGFGPVGIENPYSVGPYATGNLQEGIRNYSMDKSPLNYSDLNYDGNGATSPHADGEIWSASNFTVRQALVDKYESQFSVNNKPLQFQCADGLKPAAQCPGNRRWIQLMFDGFLIQAAGAGMADAAVAQLAADKSRFGGANQKEIWEAYASRGLGGKSEDGGFPDWSNPTVDNEVHVTFKVKPEGALPDEAFVHVGHYSGRTSEATIAKKALGGAGDKVVEMVPGTYTFTVRADGYGLTRITKRIERPAGKKTLTVEIPLRTNLASTYNGAEATGDGGNHEALIDDTEETNWAYLGADIDQLAEGRQVTVDLAGGKQTVAELQLSAVNRPQQENNAYDPIAQNRFAALRSFEILACDSTGGDDCDDDAGYQVVYISKEDAFATKRPRPRTPDLLMRTFRLDEPVEATHLRIRVLSNQCTGNPLYTAGQNPIDSTELTNADCINGTVAGANFTNTDPDTNNLPRADGNNTQRHRVRIAELQVFATASTTQPDTDEDEDEDEDTDEDTDTGNKPTPVAKPRHPATGVSPSVALLALGMTAAAAAALRRRRTA